MTLVLGFVPRPIQVAVDQILPSHQPPRGLTDTQKYKQILASIQEVDLIEPLSVGPVDKKTGQHLLLDGHVRLIALKELGYVEVSCLVATEDEAYTYNNRVNRLSSVQEHVMIRRAVDRGLTPERLARALSVDAAQILKKMNMLDGISPEAVELLKDRQFSPDVFVALRKMNMTRQVECAELMVSANNVTIVYARALLSATPPERLVDAKKATRPKGLGQEQLVLMQREMSSLQDQYRMAEQTYGEDMLNLVLARGYVSKLIDNKQVFRYLERNHGLLPEQFVNLARGSPSEI